jgi:hypothetical protein
MINSYLELYCKEKNYKIKKDKIFLDKEAIGFIDFKEKVVILGNSKYKYGDFAVAILNNFFDLYDGSENVNIQS